MSPNESKSRDPCEAAGPNGVTASSEDSNIVVVTAAEKKKEKDTDLADSFAMLKEHGVDIGLSSKKVGKVKLNGVDAEEMLFQGKEKLGRHTDRVSVTIVVLPIKDKVIVLTHFVSTDDAKKSKEAAETMVKSLKAAS